MYERQSTAFENVVLGELGLLEEKNIETIGCGDLGLPSEHEKIIRDLLKAENRKPKERRSVPYVISEFNKRKRLAGRQNAGYQDSSAKRREKNQGEALGLLVIPVREHWQFAKIGGKKVHILSSAGYEDPNTTIAYYTTLKDKLDGEFADFIIAAQINRSGDKILQALIRIQWEEFAEERINFLTEDLNKIERTNIGSWFYDKATKTIYMDKPTSLGRVEMVERVRNVLFG